MKCFEYNSFQECKISVRINKVLIASKFKFLVAIPPRAAQSGRIVNKSCNEIAWDRRHRTLKVFEHRAFQLSSKTFGSALRYHEIFFSRPNRDAKGPVGILWMPWRKRDKEDVKYRKCDNLTEIPGFTSINSTPKRFPITPTRLNLTRVLMATVGTQLVNFCWKTLLTNSDWAF